VGVIKWSTRGGPWEKKWSHGIYGFLCDVFMFWRCQVCQVLLLKKNI